MKHSIYVKSKPKRQTPLSPPSPFSSSPHRRYHQTAVPTPPPAHPKSLSPQPIDINMPPRVMNSKPNSSPRNVANLVSHQASAGAKSYLTQKIKKPSASSSSSLIPSLSINKFASSPVNPELSQLQAHEPLERYTPIEPALPYTHYQHSHKSESNTGRKLIMTGVTERFFQYDSSNNTSKVQSRRVTPSKHSEQNYYRIPMQSSKYISKSPVNSPEANTGSMMTRANSGTLKKVILNSKKRIFKHIKSPSLASLSPSMAPMNYCSNNNSRSVEKTDIQKTQDRSFRDQGSQHVLSDPNLSFGKHSSTHRFEEHTGDTNRTGARNQELGKPLCSGSGKSGQKSVSSYEKMSYRKPSKGTIEYRQMEGSGKYKMQAIKKATSYQNFDSGKRKSTASSENQATDLQKMGQSMMSHHAKNIMSIYGVGKNAGVQKKSSQFLISMTGEQAQNIGKPIKRPIPSAYISTTGTKIAGNNPNYQATLHKKNISVQMMNPLSYKPVLSKKIHHRSQSEYSMQFVSNQGHNAYLKEAECPENIETEATPNNPEMLSQRTMLAEYGRITDRAKYDTHKVNPQIRQLMAQSEFASGIKDASSIIPSNQGSYMHASENPSVSEYRKISSSGKISIPSLPNTMPSSLKASPKSSSQNLHQDHLISAPRIPHQPPTQHNGLYSPRHQKNKNLLEQEGLLMFKKANPIHPKTVKISRIKYPHFNVGEIKESINPVEKVMGPKISQAQENDRFMKIEESSPITERHVSKLEDEIIEETKQLQEETKEEEGSHRSKKKDRPSINSLGTARTPQQQQNTGTNEQGHTGGTGNRHLNSGTAPASPERGVPPEEPQVDQRQQFEEEKSVERLTQRALNKKYGEMGGTSITSSLQFNSSDRKQREEGERRKSSDKEEPLCIEHPQNHPIFTSVGNKEQQCLEIVEELQEPSHPCETYKSNKKNTEDSHKKSDRLIKRDVEQEQAGKREEEKQQKFEHKFESTSHYKRKATKGEQSSSKESSPKRKKTSSLKKSILDKKMSIREEQEKPYTERIQSRKEKEITNISFKKISSRQELSSTRSQKQLEFQLKKASQLYEQDSICFSSESMIDGNFSPLKKMKQKTMGYIEKYKRKYKRIPDTILQFYTIGKIIGRGAFGKVHLAIHKLTGEFVAIKSLPKKHLTNERQLRKVKQETALLKKIRHPCLVNLLENFETQSHVLFVMELCAGGDLLSYVRRRRHLKESVAKYIFYQIVNGIQHCHHKKIIHRDIKLENILLDAKGNVKICDFGVSKIVKQGEVIKDKTGTPAYIAPEVIMDKGYSYPVDIWSAGVVLYAMLEGAVPFRGEDMNELRKNILSAKYQMPEGISKEAKDLLRHVLVIDPMKRYEIRDILEHKWMQDIDHSQFLFTPTEINLVKQEFFYVESLPKQVGDQTFFTEHGLDSEPTEQEDKNETDKSYILAPFNSQESKVDFDFTEKEKKLMKPPQAIHFNRKVRQINRDYEATHCKELDNGVYHRFAYNSEEGVQILCHKEEEAESGKKKGHSKKLSLNEEQISQIRGALNHSNMMESFDVKNSCPNSPSSSMIGRHESSSVVVNFEIAQEMEKMGFPKNFVIKSLKRKEYNHATTTYYLIVGSKQPNAFNLELD